MSRGAAAAPPTPQSDSSPWLTPKDAAGYLRCGTRLVYDACRSGRLRHARLAGRRELRFRREWLDSYVETFVSAPIEVRDRG